MRLWSWNDTVSEQRTHGSNISKVELTECVGLIWTKIEEAGVGGWSLVRFELGSWTENRWIEIAKSVTEIGTSGKWFFFFPLQAFYDQLDFIYIEFKQPSKQVMEDDTTKLWGAR